MKNKSTNKYTINISFSHCHVGGKLRAHLTQRQGMSMIWSTK